MSRDQIDFIKDMITKGYVEQHVGVGGVSIDDFGTDDELYEGKKKLCVMNITVDGEIYLLRMIDTICKKVVELPEVKSKGVKPDEIRPVFELQLAVDVGTKLKQLMFLGQYREDYDKFLEENHFVLVDRNKIDREIKESLSGENKTPSTDSKPTVETTQAVTKGPTYH